MTIGTRLGTRIKVELNKNQFLHEVAQSIQTPPAQNPPSLITRVIR